MLIRCDTCLFFEDRECRRYPPVPLQAPDGPMAVVVQPLPWYSCGEHRYAWGRAVAERVRRAVAWVRARWVA